MELTLSRLTRRPGNEESSRQTRQRLQAAMLELMQQKRIGDIKITELTRLAGVSRQAYYRNFQSMQELLRSIKQELAQRINDNVPRVGADGLTHSWYCRFFEAVQKEAHTISVLLASLSTSRSTWLGFSVLNYMTPEDGGGYRILAYDSAMNAIVSRWILCGIRETAEEMADMCDKMFAPLNRELVGKAANP